MKCEKDLLWQSWGMWFYFQGRVSLCIQDCTILDGWAFYLSIPSLLSPINDTIWKLKERSQYLANKFDFRLKSQFLHSPYNHGTKASAITVHFLLCIQDHSYTFLVMGFWIGCSFAGLFAVREKKKISWLFLQNYH